MPTLPGLRELRRAAAHPMGRTVVARVGSLVPTSLATLLLTRLVLDHYGTRVFNGYVLVISTMAMLPLNDLGMGTAVTNSFVEHGPQDERSERVALAAARVLFVGSVIVAVIALALSAADAWDDLLGDGADTGPAFGIAMALYAVSLVPGMGQSMLLGVNRSHLTIVVLTLFLPLTAATIGIAIALDAPGWWPVVLPGLAMALVRLVLAGVSARVTRFRWRRLLARLLAPRRYPGARIRSTAAPALITALSVPLALQSDRLVLSHFAEEVELANYAVCVQLFAPILGVMAAGAQPLWPVFAKARAEGTTPPSMVKIAGGIAGVTAVICALVVLVADSAGRVVGGEQIDLGVLLPTANALVVVVQAIAYPMAMAMMYPRALRFVALCCAVAVPINVGASIVLAQALGAPGPLLGSALVALVVQVGPGLVYFRREQRRHQIGVPDPEAAVALPPVGLPGTEGLATPLPTE